MKNEVSGTIKYDVSVKCPNCKVQLNLMDYPYDEDEELQGRMGMMVFGGPRIYPQWSNLDIPIDCRRCKHTFVLNNFIYKE